MRRHPSTKWAQGSDKVYITIELPDAKDVKQSLQPEGQFQFLASSGPDDIPYEIDFELFDKVNVDESKAAVGSRTICYLIKKAEKKWWSRLLKQEGKPPAYLKVDWDKWIYEDDEKENEFGSDLDPEDMDFSKLNMGNADDDGTDDDSSDTDEPDGEDAKLEAKPEEDNKAET